MKIKPGEMRFSFVAVILALAPLCLAGDWVISYSGGQWATQSDSGLYVTYEGGWGTEQVYGAGFGNCTGQITITATWDDHEDPLDTPPKSVVYKTHSLARWAGDSGSASNGLGHNASGGPNGATSEGSRSYILNDPGTSFTVYITPLASSVAGGGGGGGEEEGEMGTVTVGEVEVHVHLTVSDVRINVGGAIPSTPSKTNILPGQTCLATVFCAGYTVLYHSWNLGGPLVSTAHHIEWGSDGTGPFGSYIDSRKSMGWPPGHKSLPTFRFLAEESGELELTCAVKIYDGSTLIGDANAEIDVSSWEPYYFYNYSMGKLMFNNPKSVTDPTVVEAYESPAMPIFGAYFEAKVGTPTFFSNTLGYGRFDFVQLLDFFNQWWQGIVRFTSESGFMDLDNVYPYAQGGIADHVLGSDDPVGWTFDSPALELNNGGLLSYTKSFETDHQFWMFLTYTPPEHPSGGGVDDVALHFVEWNMAGIDSRSYGGNWTNIYPTGGNLVVTDNDSFPAWRYQWDDVWWPGK